MRIFWKNTVKITSASGAPSPDPRVVTVAYYYNLVEFVSSVKCVSLFSEKDKMTTVHVLLLLLPHFCTYFSLQTLQILRRGAQKYFLPQGAGYPSYATVLAYLNTIPFSSRT